MGNAPDGRLVGFLRLAVVVDRDRLAAADFTPSAWEVLERVQGELVIKARGRARELGPLKLTGTAFADLAP